MKTATHDQPNDYPANLPVGGADVFWRTGDTWQRAIDDWSMWLRAGNKATATLYQRRWQLRLLAEAYPGRSPWKLSNDDLVRWLTGRGWGPEAVKSGRSALRSFYGWAVDTRRTKRNPALTLPQVRVQRHLPRPAGDFEFAQGLDGASDKVRLMILLGALAGLRASEIAKLRWDQIEDGHLHIRGKGDRERHVPIHSLLAAELNLERSHRDAGGIGSGYRYIHHADVWVFPGQSGGGMHPGHVSHVLSAALGPVTGHQLRHRFATRALAVDGNLRAVQKLLGHASPTTTAVYTAVADDTLTATVNAL
jgi:integrase/recombinase XerC